MKGSMREKRPGYWQLRVFEGADPVTGMKEYRTQVFRGTKREAQNALALLVSQVNAGVVKTRSCTVEELIGAWLAHIENVGRSPSTLYNYRRVVAQLPDGFKALPLSKVTPKVVDDLYRFLAKETGRKPATVVRFHAVLRAAFGQAVKGEWIERNPIDRATPPSVQRVEMVPPAVIDVLRVLERAAQSKSPDNALAFRLLAATGCRRGEVCGLKWSDLELDSERPRVVIRRAVLDIARERIVQDTKTHALRSVGLDEGTVELLRQHRGRAVELADAAGVAFDPGDFVFPKRPGSKEPMPPNTIGQAWRRYCEELGVGARLHDLRHLQASLLLDAGEAITTVSARLGHRDSSTTLRIYSHLMPGSDQRAAAIVGSAFTQAASPSKPS
ncbi:MAG: tyrosine-type recombinase/integrase [Acidimicrobiales bacterium]